MPISEKTYEQVAVEDPAGAWELVCGRLRKKPEMTFAHDGTIIALQEQLVLQLDATAHAVSVNLARLRVSTGTYFVPDICVIPRALLTRGMRERPQRLEVYEEPMPLVVEVWSPSTGDYDVEEKLREYQRRGDLEIWRVHPYERTLTAWSRTPGGSYGERFHKDGAVYPASLPGVTIDLSRLFA